MINSPERQIAFSHNARVLRSAVGCLTASLLVAAFMIAFRGGFGASDIWPFFLWSLPLAVGVAVVSYSLIRLVCHLSVFVRYLLTALAGVIVGVIWAFIVAFVLGPWVGAFSFPVLSCWVAGGASGMVIGTEGCHESKRNAAIQIVLIVSICLFAVIGTKPLSVLLSGDQRLEVLYVERKPKSGPLSVDKLDGFGLTDRELMQLKSVGVTGKLEVVRRSVYGSGEYSRAVIVMYRQVDEPVELSQPDNAEVIYIQHEEEWKLYPPDARTLTRKIGLEPSKQDPRDTMGWVELANGARQGGLAFSW